MARLFMLIGISGSGKSTWAASQLYKEGMFSEIYSSDVYRQKLLGDVNNQEYNSYIFNTLHKDLKKALLLGKDVCYDATNISKRNRSRFLREIKDINNIEKIAVVFNVSPTLAKEQNQNRSRIVPEIVIDKQFNRFVQPQLDEGFTKIIIINGDVINE